MLGDVGHGRGHHRLRLGVLPQGLHHDRILQRGLMHRDVRCVILVPKSLDRLPHQHAHVLRHRVHRRQVIFHRDELVRVLDAEHLQHVAVEQRQVVDLRRRLRELDNGLILHQPLGHRGCARVAHRDDVDHRVVGRAVCRRAVVGLVVVRLVVVEPLHQRFQDPQLLLEAGVGARLDGGHDLELPLQQRQRGAHRRLRGHVRDLQVCHAGQAPAVFDDLVQQIGQHHAGFFVRQRQDVVADAAPADIHVPELARLDRLVVVLDAHSASFEPARQVRQRASVDQLSQKACAGLGVAADQVEQPQAVRAKPGDVVVLHEVLLAHVQQPVLAPVAAHGKQHVVVLEHRDDVLRRHAAWVQRVVDVHADQGLVDRVAVVVDVVLTDLLVLCLLDLPRLPHRLPDVAGHVEALCLQRLDVMLVGPHHMDHARGVARIGRAVWEQHVLGGDELGHGTLERLVPVHLLERAATARQVEQQHLVLVPELLHLFGDEVVHVRPHAQRRLHLLAGFLAQHLGEHRPAGRERLHHRLGLETDHRFEDHGVRDAAGPRPRLVALLVLEPQ